MLRVLSIFRGRAILSNMAAPRTGDDVVDALLAAAHAVRVRTDARLRELGLSLARLKVLELLQRSGPLRLRDLSDGLSVAARTMTTTAEGLERDGLVERQPHPADRRARLLTLTPLGLDRLADARQERSAVVRTFTEGLPEADRAELLRLLRVLAARRTPTSA